jgi:site-specific DNA recombinase
VTTAAVPRAEWIWIPVPALVEADLFAVVQEQLQENRRYAREQSRARYLLSGLVRCRQCGYAYCGRPAGQRGAPGQQREYTYYHCLGTDRHRCGGERVCENRAVRSERLEAAVWEEVCLLLADPARLRQEYERRLQPAPAGQWESEHAGLEARLGKLRQGLGRLIDGYADGLLEKEEFEPRLSRQRERIGQLEEQLRALEEQTTMQAELRLILGRLEEFAIQVQEGLAAADWSRRRELIRTLVKRVEVDETAVEVVFRVPPAPFESRPERGVLPHCRWRERGTPAKPPPLSPSFRNLTHARLLASSPPMDR